MCTRGLAGHFFFLTKNCNPTGPPTTILTTDVFGDCSEKQGANLIDFLQFWPGNGD